MMYTVSNKSSKLVASRRGKARAANQQSSSTPPPHLPPTTPFPSQEPSDNKLPLILAALMVVRGPTVMVLNSEAGGINFASRVRVLHNILGAEINNNSFSSAGITQNYELRDSGKKDMYPEMR